MTDEFDGAKFYCIGDPDELQHEGEDEAVGYHVDAHTVTGEPCVECIRRICPLTVDAYSPDAVDPGWVKRTTERIMESVNDEWSEYGDPDEDFFPGGPDAAQTLELRLAEVLNDFVGEAHVWSCHKVGSRTYSADEVEAMMREYSPEWFEDDGRTMQSRRRRR